MSNFEFYGQPIPTWRTPLRWLRFKRFRGRLKARIKAKRDARSLRLTNETDNDLYYRSPRGARP